MTPAQGRTEACDGALHYAFSGSGTGVRTGRSSPGRSSRGRGPLPLLRPRPRLRLRRCSALRLSPPLSCRIAAGSFDPSPAPCGRFGRPFPRRDGSPCRSGRPPRASRRSPPPGRGPRFSGFLSPLSERGARCSRRCGLSERAERLSRPCSDGRSPSCPRERLRRPPRRFPAVSNRVMLSSSER